MGAARARPSLDPRRRGMLICPLGHRWPWLSQMSRKATGTVIVPLVANRPPTGPPAPGHRHAEMVAPWMRKMWARLVVNEERGRGADLLLSL